MGSSAQLELAEDLKLDKISQFVLDECDKCPWQIWTKQPVLRQRGRCAEEL